MLETLRKDKRLPKAPSYAWIACLVLAMIVAPWLLIVFASIPKAVEGIKGFRGKTLPVEMMPAMKSVAQTNTLFGLLLVVGILCQFYG